MRRVFIVDDDPSVRDSLAWLLASDGIPHQSFEHAESFLEKYRPDWHGCVLMDVRMPGLSGLELQEEMRARGVSLPVIVVTGHADVPMAIRAMKAGAFDFIEKPYSDEVLLGSIRRALDVAERSRGRELQVAEIQARYTKLTTREREVMAGVIDGSSNKLIASNLGLSSKTVEVHRARLMSKMQAASLSELVRLSIQGEIHTRKEAG